MIVLFFSFDIICEALKAEQIYTLLIVWGKLRLAYGSHVSCSGIRVPALRKVPPILCE